MFLTNNVGTRSGRAVESAQEDKLSQLGQKQARHWDTIGRLETDIKSVEERARADRRVGKEEVGLVEKRLSETESSFKQKLITFKEEVRVDQTDLCNSIKEEIKALGANTNAKVEDLRAKQVRSVLTFFRNTALHKGVGQLRHHQLWGDHSWVPRDHCGDEADHQRDDETGGG